MRPLLRLGLARGRMGLAAYLGAFAVAYWDLIDAWYADHLPLVVAAVAGLSLLAGIASLARVIGVDSHDLVEPLPLSRVAVWCAGAVDALLLVAVAVLLLGSLRTLFPQPDPRLWVSEPAMFRTATGPLAVLAAAAATGLGAGLFLGSIAARELTAIAGAAPFAIVAGAATVLIPGLHRVRPSLLESAPLLGGWGACLAVAGLGVHLLAPARLTSWRERRVAVALVCAAVTVIPGVGLEMAARAWQRLEPGETIEIRRALVVPGAPGTILIDASSIRSGDHLLEIDFVGKTVRDLGRDTFVLSADRQPMTGDMAFTEGGWLWLGTPGRSARRVLALDRSTPDGGPARATDFEFTPKGEFLVFCLESNGAAESQCSPWAVVADRAGQERLNFPGRNCLIRVGTSSDGRVVVTDVADGDIPGHSWTGSGKLDDLQISYVVLSPETGVSTRLSRPALGVILTVEPTRYLWHRVRLDGDRLRQSIRLVDAVSGSSLTLLAEEDMEAVPAIASVKLRRKTSPLTDLRWKSRRLDQDEPAPAGATAGDFAALLIPRLRGEVIESRLIAFDLVSGERRDLVGPDELPRVALGESDELPQLLGFDAPGAAVLYRTGEAAFRVEIATGVRTVVGRWPRPRYPNSIPLRVSPDGHHVRLDTNEVEHHWLADGRLVTAHHGRLTLTDVDAGTAPVTLYPPAGR